MHINGLARFRKNQIIPEYYTKCLFFQVQKVSGLKQTYLAEILTERRNTKVNWPGAVLLLSHSLMTGFSQIKIKFKIAQGFFALFFIVLYSPFLQVK